MFAVIRTGGKQYRVAPDDVIRVEKVAGEAGDIIRFGEVLMLGGDAPRLGSPTVEGASVAAEVLEQTRSRKVLVFKKKRRKNYRRTHGHRQHLTAVRITEILTDGREPSRTRAEPRARRQAQAAAAETDKAPAGKTAPAKKAPPKKTPAKTAAKAGAATAKKAPAKKAPAKKAPAKKGPAKKAPAKKAPAKKAPKTDG